MTIKRKRLWIILGSVVLTLVLFYVLSPAYVQRALIYTTAGIDDYKIFENRTVEAGEHQPWPVASKLKTIPDKHLDIIEAYDPVAFLVIQDSTIISETYWDGYSADSHSNAFSMTKSIIALLTGIAIEDGYIKSVDQPVGDFFPEFRQGDKSRITIRHVLQMASGLEWDEHYFNPFSRTTEAYYGNDLRGLILNLEAVTQPDSIWKYQSGDTQLLALLLSEVTGKTVSDYCSEKLWKPMGAKHNALWCLDRKDGDEKAYCCFNSNARDFARFGQLILSDGNWHGQQLVPKAYLKDALTPASHLKDAWQGKSVDFYGYQWWILHYKGMTIPYMRGMKGQYVFAIPDKNAVVVRLGHKRSKERTNFTPSEIFWYIDAALDVMD